MDDAIDIFDHKFAYAKRKWLYAVATRASDRKNVYVYEYDKSKDNETQTEQYFVRNVEG